MRMRFLLLALLVMAKPSHAQDERVLLQQAKTQSAVGHEERAIQIYRTLLSSNPSNVEALAACSYLLETNGRWREAVPLLTRQVELEPQNADALYRLGRMKSWMDGGSAEATTLLRGAADLEPGNPGYQVAYAEVLGRRSQNLPESIAILKGVVATHAEQVEARRLLARMLGRQHQTDEALQVLQPLFAGTKTQIEDYQTQAEIYEIAGNMQAAAGDYRAILQMELNNVAAISKLAEILSWKIATRQESIALYERAIKLDPANDSLALDCAQLLSWDHSSRARAFELFDSVLARSPDNPSALDGKAQVLAWSGHSADALALYDKVLAKNPADADALRGKAEILNWRGRYAESRDLLARAHQIAPNDPRTNLEMARADVGLHRYAEARDDIGVRQLQAPEFNQVVADINRGLGTYLEWGYIGRRNRQQLDFNRLDVRVSTPINSANRVTFDYQPTLYSTVPMNFNSNHFGAALDSDLSEQVGTHAELSADQFPGEPTEWNTVLGMHYRLRNSWVLHGGFERQPVFETLLSTRGLEIGALLRGHVQSNLASVGASYSNSVHHYDASFTYTDGVYTGNNLDSNRRWGFDFNLGKSVRGNAPYLRIAYGASYLSFDHDSDFQPGEAAPQVTGGYYSPSRFLLNYGGMNAAHKFGRKLEWDAAGTAGVQNAETTFTKFSSAQFASSFATHLLWHVGAKDDIRGGYDFLNVFNAFHRHLFLVGWRHYF